MSYTVAIVVQDPEGKVAVERTYPDKNAAASGVVCIAHDLGRTLDPKRYANPSCPRCGGLLLASSGEGKRGHWHCVPCAYPDE